MGREGCPGYFGEPTLVVGGIGGAQDLLPPCGSRISLGSQHRACGVPGPWDSDQTVLSQSCLQVPLGVSSGLWGGGFRVGCAWASLQGRDVVSCPSPHASLPLRLRKWPQGWTVLPELWKSPQAWPSPWKRLPGAGVRAFGCIGQRVGPWGSLPRASVFLQGPPGRWPRRLKPWLLGRGPPSCPTSGPARGLWLGTARLIVPHPPQHWAAFS